MVCSDMTAIQKYYPDATAVWLKNGEPLILDGLRVQIDRRTLGKILP